MIRLILALALLCAPFCQGDVETRFRDIKRHVQVGPTQFEFLGGALDLGVSDGNAIVSGCTGQPSTTIIPPSVACPPGTQGLVAFGDLSLDGEVNAPGLFYAITSVQAATQVEPFRTDRVQLLAAPPGGLANIIRSSGGDFDAIFDVQDTSIIIWWDVLGFPIQQYEITGYGGQRTYDAGDAELARQYFEVRYGASYVFSYPVLDDPQNPFDDLLQLDFGVTHNVTPDVYPGRGLILDGWRMTMTPDRWVDLQPPFRSLALTGIFGRESTPVAITRALEVDPRSFFQFIWNGINFSNTLASDSLFFSMLGEYPGGYLEDLDGACVPPTDIDGDPILTESEFGIVFPPYSPCTPEGQRDEILIGTFDGQLDLPPFFFAPGDFHYAHFRFVRGLFAGAGTTDASERSILVPISFVETWEGFRTFSAPFPSRGGFPFGTRFALRTPYGDFDGDGWDNLTEFALFSDIADSSDAEPGDTGILPAQPDFNTFLTTENNWSSVAVERPFLTQNITFEFDYSFDGGTTWFPITEGDSDWAVTTGLVDATGEAVTYVVVDPLIGPQPYVDVAFDEDGEVIVDPDTGLPFFTEDPETGDPLDPPAVFDPVTGDIILDPETGDPLEPREATGALTDENVVKYIPEDMPSVQVRVRAVLINE